MNRRNYKVTVSYDGTEYKGWQYQANGLRTVQGEIARVLSILAKKKINVTGSSRTDAGVHSKGLCANFKIAVNIEPGSLLKAMNSLLPGDIRITECTVMPGDFNARFGSKSKTYVYKIYRGLVQPPEAYRFSIHIPYYLNLSLIRKCLPLFVGEKDFSSFTSDEPQKKRVRTVTEFSVKKSGDFLIFTVRGKSFLRYMVRNMIGTVLDIGRGKIDYNDLPGIFEAKDRSAAGQTAPSKGLVLEKVEYD